MNDTERTAQLRQHLAMRISATLSAGGDIAWDIVGAADLSSESAIDRAISIAAAEASHRAQLAQWQAAQLHAPPPAPTQQLQQPVGFQQPQPQYGPSDFPTAPNVGHGAARSAIGGADLASQAAAEVSRLSAQIRSGDRSVATAENRAKLLAFAGAPEGDHHRHPQLEQRGPGGMVHHTITHRTVPGPTVHPQAKSWSTAQARAAADHLQKTRGRN